MIKNIIFDMSEVIISGYYGVENIVEKKTNISASEFLRVKQETIDIFFETMRGNLTEEEYWKNIIENYNWDITIEQIKNMIRENLNIPVNGTMEIIKKLKCKYNLILLSDHVREWMDYITDNNKDLDIFDKKIFSYELGKCKKDKETFGLILKTQKINADETIFIDDAERNINMAKSYGINSILFTTAEDLEKQLIKLNIL